jgi:hypothetical protein
MLSPSILTHAWAAQVVYHSLRPGSALTTSCPRYTPLCAVRIHLRHAANLVHVVEARKKRDAADEFRKYTTTRLQRRQSQQSIQ